MRWRAANGLVVAALLGGCIPQVERDYRAAHPQRDAAAQPAGAAPIDYVKAVPEQRDDAPRDELRAPEPMPPTRLSPSRSRAPVQALPAPRPVWEARPAAEDARTVAASTYIARPGDTLGTVAERTGAGSGAIARANGLSPPFAIVAGQRLTVPGGRYHVVRPGEAGMAIARAYGVAWSRIVAANALEEPFVLHVGQRILIPATAPGSNRIAERAAAFTLDVDDILTGGEPAPSRDQAPVRPVKTPTRVLPPTAIVAAPARLNGGFIWPVDGRITRRFGPGAPGQRNDGVKIAVPIGTPIRAAANGVVAYVGDGIAALGGLVIVKHGDGWTSVYGHASHLLVQRGESVRQGQTIALSGDTGFADRPQVHFELRKGRTPVDPQSELPRR